MMSFATIPPFPLKKRYVDFHPSIYTPIGTVVGQSCGLCIVRDGTSFPSHIISFEPRVPKSCRGRYTKWTTSLPCVARHILCFLFSDTKMGKACQDWYTDRLRTGRENSKSPSCSDSRITFHVVGRSCCSVLFWIDAGLCPSHQHSTCFFYKFETLCFHGCLMLVESSVSNNYYVPFVLPLLAAIRDPSKTLTFCFSFCGLISHGYTRL